MPGGTDISMIAKDLIPRMGAKAFAIMERARAGELRRREGFGMVHAEAEGL
jgi:hypothetical protein